ncbi:hypothetical protein SUGI_0782140 [Cryptomeria japonica]|uniref:pentatricopeptide repeat-containing protein At2g15630, mitochondrial isoform X2 n=1 Tax=Cryptomeria japonica TaxID=3369 RepID=UPI0024148FFB|nr:pentatricopeptide repeat-containing protein At2g15630, mitochondrial isoform X2 [Cryptomeria japonica]GLJ38412.1 hypothetical protein SUGI_0782140 [Cryptomeria japonica]
MAACHLWRRFLITQLRRQTCVSSSPIYKCKLSMHVKTSNHGKFEDGLELLGRMKAEGIRPLSGTYTHILNGFVKGGEFDKAHLFLLQESGNNPSLDSSNYESLIRSCSSAGREKEAYELFMEMKFKGLELLDDQLCKEVLENHGVDEET